jgi:hypothetical protein
MKHNARIAILVVLIVALAVVLSGCGAEKEEKPFTTKVWKEGPYQKVTSAFDPDMGNYAIVEVQSIEGECAVKISLGNNEPLTFRNGEKKAFRALPVHVHYPGSNHWLAVRQVVLMQDKKPLQYAYRRW